LWNLCPQRVHPKLAEQIEELFPLQKISSHRIVISLYIYNIINLNSYRTSMKPAI
jgi:hypothetical protein